jgi:pimeloyl-ACP methyl ester carboxylesterase
MFALVRPLTRRLVQRVAPFLLLLLALLVAGPGTSATADTPSGRHGHATTKPTIVLVHGAWADGSSWRGVVHRLQSRGYPVRVPAVTLRSLASDAINLSNLVSTISGPVVLVGHSYGGAVITNMPIDPDVTALVFVNGFAPAAGEELAALSGPDSALAVSDPTTVFDFVPYTGGPAGDVEIYLKQDIFRTAFASDLPTRRADMLWATQRPITFSALHEPSAAPAWASVPSWYAVGDRDLILPPAAQAAMAQRAGSATRTVRAGHLSHVSRPGAVTAIIDEAATATRD